MKPRSTPSEAPQHEAQSLALTLEKPIYGGAALGRLDGKAVFVPLTLPGEEARVRIVESKSGYCTAEAEEILSAAPERVGPRCPHFGACGGCHYQHAVYEAQLGMKQAILRETLERAGVAAPERIETLASEPWGYRNRVRLAFDRNGRPGYRSRRSHEVVAIRDCPVIAPLLLRVAQAVDELLSEQSTPAPLREMALFTNADESALLASFTVEEGARFPLHAFAQELAGRIPQLTGAELLMEQPRRGRTQPEPRRTASWGEASLVYNVGGHDYRVDQGAFFQGNRLLLEAFVDRVVAGRRGALAWDLYAGVGLFARRLAEGFARVVAVESAPNSRRALTANLQVCGGEGQCAATLDFLRGAKTTQRPDLIVVDPPRTGLGPQVCEQLGQKAAPELVYVSCDPATMARDLRLLLGAGYALESVALADMFPQTFHMETVAVLRRS